MAASRAACGVMPRAMLSSVSIAMYDAISRAASSSRVLRRKKRIHAMALLRRPHHLTDRAHQLFPARGFRRQHLPPGRRQPVVLRLAVVFRGPPERRDERAIFEAVERRIEGAVLDLEH